MASGAAYLTSAEIESAVASLKDNFNLALGLIKAIQDFKKNSPDLKMTRRHPVILILDEVYTFNKFQIWRGGGLQALVNLKIGY